MRSLVSRPPTLEELFLRHYGDELTGRCGTVPSGDARMTGTGAAAAAGAAPGPDRAAGLDLGIVLTVVPTAASYDAALPDRGAPGRRSPASASTGALRAINGPAST